MKLPKPGTMRPIKLTIGWIISIAGAGLIFMPDKTAQILCGQKLLFGIIVAAAGYFLVTSGRQRQ